MGECRYAAGQLEQQGEYQATEKRLHLHWDTSRWSLAIVVAAACVGAGVIEDLQKIGLREARWVADGSADCGRCSGRVGAMYESAGLC